MILLQLLTIDHDLVGFSDRRRLSATCPNVNSNRCMGQLKALTQSMLGTVCSFPILMMPAGDDVGNALPDRCWIQSDWCYLEDWFTPLIDDNNGRGALIVNTFWTAGKIIPLHILAIATSFTACGFQKFMSIAYEKHRWWHMATLATITVAGVVTGIKTFGLTFGTALGFALAGGRLLNTKVAIVQYVDCITS